MIFVFIAIACLLFADIEIITLTPWHEFSRMLQGFLNPRFIDSSSLFFALLRTVAFAALGVAISSVCGFGLALIFNNRLVIWTCAFIRSIHELFWALIFLQLFGLHPLTGILAIAVPYTGVFAKVYAEILEENQHSAFRLLDNGRNYLTRFFYTYFPNALPHLRSYTLYRFECGLRSSAILGFLGIPTLGFYLESAFMQGFYDQVTALLLLFYALIASLKHWLNLKSFLVYLLIAPFLVGSWSQLYGSGLLQFFTLDIVPAPLRLNSNDIGLIQWLSDLLFNQALPGLLNTFILTQIVLVATAILSLLMFPLVSEHFTTKLGRRLGHIFLVIIRSTPEYILAFTLLLIWGPSLLPAIVALSIHNSGIIAHLIGHASNQIKLRSGHARGINLYGYEVLPRVFNQLLAFLFYRWEIIFRESAILGILGIHTLGYFIVSAMEELHFDRAIILITITALINILLDHFSRRIRHRLKLKTQRSLVAE